jgi:hypothetical protein
MTRLLRAMVLFVLVFSAKEAFAGTCPTGNQTIDPLGNPIAITNVGVTGSIAGSITTCFYVSNSTGADTNNGTSEATPWAHMPGMPDCTGVCASTTPSSGTGIILRGGDTWVSGDLPINWLWNGTSTHPIYVGVDQTWYNSATCGAVWCRPIFNASGTSGDMFNVANRSWVIFDNIEIKGMTNAQNGFRESGGSNFRATQNYFHAWSHTGSSNNVGFFSQCGAGSMQDHNVIDGSDSTQNTMNGVYSSCAGTIQYNYFSYMVSGILGSIDNLNNNIILNSITSADGDHCNGMFVFGPQTGLTTYVYNNIVGNMICQGGVNFWLNGNASPGNSSWVSTAYNNLILASAASGNVFNIGGHPTQGNSGAYNVYNNTIVALNGSTCFGNGEASPRSTTNYANNHCIGGTVMCDATGTTCVNGGGNVLQSIPVATTQGYTSTELEVYSPISTCVAGSCSSLGAGINESSLCTGSLSALCTSTAYPTYNSSNHTMGTSSTKPAGVARGSSWDAGVYQFSGGTVGGGGTGGIVSLVQQVEIGSGTQVGSNPVTPAATFPLPQAAGDANVIVVEYCGQPGWGAAAPNCLSSNSPGPISSITDTAGNTYVRNCGPLTTTSSGSYTNNCGGGTPTQDGYNVTVEVWSAVKVKSAAAGNVVTAHMPAVSNMNGWNVWMFQLHPASGSIVFDQYVSKQTGGVGNLVAGPISTGTTASTNYPNEFAFAYCMTANGTCPGPLNVPTWIQAPLNGSVYYDTHSDTAYRIITSQQTLSESFTAGSGATEWLGFLVTYGASGSQAQLPQAPTNLQAVVQ